MAFLKYKNTDKSLFFVVLASFLSIVLQVQVSLFAEGDYLGLRIGLADMFLPVIGFVVIVSLLSRKTLWPEWSVPYFWCWLGALFLVFSASLFNGWITVGEWSSWALINKYLGFFILLSYLGLGGWIATNVKDKRALFSNFALFYCAFLVFCVWASIAAFFFDALLGGDSLWIARYPWDGFMANRNAFMVVLVLAMVFILHSYLTDDFRISNIVRDGFWMCLPTFFMFNGSRTGWICVFILYIGFLFFSIRKPYLKRVLLFSILGGLLGCLSFYVTTDKHIVQGRQFERLVTLTVDGVEGVDYGGDKKRLIAVEDGLELYQRHDPIVGAGLGSYKPFQIEKRGEFIEVIDFTALWLLVEMGISGLLVFSMFFIVCAFTLYQSGYKAQKSNYHKAVFVFLIVFAGMTLLHELMYTRILWFVMGMALIRSRSNENVPA